MHKLVFGLSLAQILLKFFSQVNKTTNKVLFRTVERCSLSKKIFASFFQAFVKMESYPVSTSVSYNYGDDNCGNFYFPSITVCPFSFTKAFGEQLQKFCTGSTSTSKYFVTAAQTCSENVDSVDSFINIFDYEAKQVINLFLLGKHRLFGAKINDYWKKVLHYQHGFCYTFNPDDRSLRTVDLASRTDPLNYAILSLNVS